LRSPIRGVRHFRRYREIVRVLIHHGFGQILDALDILPYLSIPQRLLRRWRPAEVPLGTPERLRLALEELGPTFIKLGQALSTRPDLLPPAYISELSKLQDTVPPEPWDPIKARIEEELGGRTEGFFIEFEEEPIAAASLAQVHAATLPDGSEVVLKVQRPEIQGTIETDLEILFDLAELLDEHTPLGDIYDLSGIAKEFATGLRSELDFYREGRNADRLRENFRGVHYLRIPEVYWKFTTRRLLVLERIRGIKIDKFEALDEAGYDRPRIAERAADIIIQEVLEDGFFHADPHPGNFVVMPGEVIGAMDFGLVGHLSHQMRLDLIRLYVAAVELDAKGVVDQLIKVGVVSGEMDRVELERDTARLLKKYYELPLKAVKTQEAINEAMSIAFRHHLQLPSDLWLLVKTLAMMEGLARELAPGFNFFKVARPYVRRFLFEIARPGAWGPSLLKSVGDWSELLSRFPKVGSRILTKVERGDFRISLHHEGLNRALVQLDRLSNRIALSVLLAALIVGLAIIIPAFNLAEEWGLITGLIIAIFAGVSLVGLWLIVSILRSGR